MNKDEFINQFPSVPEGSVSFVNICNYQNKKGETSCVLINVGVSYENAKKKDVEYLKNLDLDTIDTDLPKSLLEEARVALIGSLISPSKARSQGQKDAYTHLGNGLKMHNETKVVYVFGMKVRKTVIVEGNFDVDTRKPLTKAKDTLKKNLKSAQYRQFTVPNFDVVSIKGETLEIE